jgi:uncharacterized oligopeptide transporter (OPT) family protein
VPEVSAVDAIIAAPTATQPHALTLRAFIAGSVLAVFLCGVNSYLTLSFGVIEEGPTIAALIFFAFFFLAKRRITVSELVIVATMGSAGGSLGFITNFYAAKAMTGTPYTFWEMTLFAIVTSLVGLAFVIPLRELLVIREKLPWPGSKATAGIITALAEGGDRRQPAILLATVIAAMAYVVLNNDGGFGVFPDAIELPLFDLAAYGAAIALSPFAVGGAYLMGFRTCVGFFFGGVTLLAMGAYLPDIPDPAAPHKYVWPGIAFLVSSGLTVMAVNWRVISESMSSLLRLKKVAAEGSADDDPTLEPRVFLIFSVVALAATLAFLVLGMGLSVALVLMLVVVGGFIQNIIATRAAAQTAFNPARVMGVLLQGLSSLMGGSAAAINLTGAGFVAGSGAQAGNLTGDMAYGRWFKIPSRYQFWAQCLTVLPCSIVAAFVFQQIHAAKPLVLQGEGHPAPVAKMWAASAQIFDGSKPLPDGVWDALLIGGAVGVVYTLIETIKPLQRWLPHSIGIGLGLVLAPSLGISFFLGGFVMWVILGGWLKWKDVTLTTIAVASIVAEGIGGVLKPLLTLLGVIK